MPLDGKLLVQAKEVLDEKRKQNSEFYLRREKEVHEKVPSIRYLDNELKSTMMELVAVSIGSKTDTKIEDIRIRNIELQKQRINELKKHGYSEDYYDEKYLCSKCNDSGYMGRAICSCLMDLYKKEQTISLSNLLKLGNETFENFNLSYYDGTPAQDTGVSPRKAMEMIYEICVEYSRNFIDDLDTEFVTKLTIIALYDLINTRLITNKKTIISYNLTLDELYRLYTEQITSRLEGDYQVLIFRGDDIRKKKRMGQ